MDAVLNLVCITKTQSELPDEVLQIIKKFMIVPELDKVFNKTDTNKIWEDLEVLVNHYNFAYQRTNHLRVPPPFTLGQQKFSQIFSILDGSCKGKYIGAPPTAHHTADLKVEWYEQKFRKTLLFEALYLYPTLTPYQQSIVEWFRELDIVIRKSGTPDLSLKLDKHLKRKYTYSQDTRGDSWNRYHHSKLEWSGGIYSARPICWGFQDLDNDETNTDYNTNAGTLKKNKKVQKSYLNSLISKFQVQPNRSIARYDLRFVPHTCSNETLRTDWGKEWLAEGPLNTKTLLRIYGGVRPTYEDSVKKSLKSCKKYKVKKSLPQQTS